MDIEKELNLNIFLKIMSNIDLTKYGITDVKEIVHNPAYEVLFAEETNPTLEGYE